MEKCKKVVLPISTNTELKIECWTFYKMSIIQTLPEYMNWLSSHMNIFYGEIGEKIYFGIGPHPHDVTYFSDILDIDEIDLYAVKPSNLIKKIKSEIDMDYYYVVFLRNEEGESHEIFIYGYDDNITSFYTFDLIENGNFVPALIRYDKVEEHYCNDYQYYLHNPEQYYCKIKFGYVMYRIKTRNKYKHKNYAAEYFEKLYHEVYGTRTDLCYSDDYDQFLPPCSFYTGVTCLIRLNDRITELKGFPESENKIVELNIIRKNLFKLREHRNLIYRSMRWYEKCWGIQDEHILDLHNNYQKCCVDMDRICIMYLKYLFTRNGMLLEKIQRNIMEQYCNERRILCEYVNVIREFYNSQVLSKKFE